MTQTSHPPARTKQSWLRAFCSVVFTLVFALMLSGAARAQVISVGVDSICYSPQLATTEEFPDDTARSNILDQLYGTSTPGYIATVNIGTVPVGNPPRRPGLDSTSVITFIIEGDISLSATTRAAYPAGDLALVPNVNATATPQPDGSLLCTVTMPAGSVDSFILFTATQDADTEGLEGYRISLLSSRSTGSARILTDYQDAYGQINDASGTPTNNSPFTVTPTSLQIDEKASKTFTVAPNTAPTSAVSVQLTSSNSNVLAISPTTLNFPAGSTAAITVTVTAISDNAFLPNVRAGIVQTLNSNSTDTNFNNKPLDDVSVQVFNTDQTSAGNTGFQVTPNIAVVYEGSTTSVTVRINSAPASAVYVPLTISDPTAARIVGSNVLVFDANNLSRTVTLQGISDGALTPSSRFATLVLSPAISVDNAYSNFDIPDVTVSVLNSDTLFKVNRSDNLVTSETGSSETFTIALSIAPTADVSVTLTATTTSPNEEVRLRAPGTTTAANAITLNFTTANFATAQTVTVIGVNDNVLDGVQPFTITGTATSADPVYAFQGTPNITGVNVPIAFSVNPPSGLITKEDGSSASFAVTLSIAPQATTTVTLTASPATEARFLSGATTTLTFTSANYTTPQTVTVYGVDDAVRDGNRTFTITGSIATTDTYIRTQTFPSVTGTNQDNETGDVTPDPGSGGNTGSGKTFAAGSTTLVSYPYTLTTDTGRTGTASVAQVFGDATDSTGTRYQLYRYNSAGQTYSFTGATAGTLGSDWVLMGPTEQLKLGQGYLLKVSASGSVAMNTPADSALLTAITTKSFPIALLRNANFKAQARKAQSFNGYNLIGFPFNPATYTTVNLSNVQVTAVTGKKTRTYETFAKAAAAGVIKGRVFGIDAQGRLTQLTATNYSLGVYSAVFVQSFRDSGQITFTLRQP